MAEMKISMASLHRILIALLTVCLIVCSFSACQSEKSEKKSNKNSNKVSSNSDASSTISIYYNENTPSSETIYDDIINESHSGSSQSDNLANDAIPELIIPSTSNAEATSSNKVSHQSETSSNIPSDSSQDETTGSHPASSKAESNSSVSQEAVSSEDVSSAVSSYDKSFTKPY